ncbi:hypothetical protein KKG45_04765, partial [bacterium]|nr:hypothetical protein [bacterium]
MAIWAEQPFFVGLRAVLTCSDPSRNLCFADPQRQPRGATVTPARNPAEQPILVRKYGGTSIASVERIGAVAGDLVAKKQEGYRLVVVVSAMGHHTDELEHLARSVAPQPPRRELDLLLSVGERISMTLLSMALQAHGCSAISFTGSQCGLITDCSHTEACILEVKG